MAIFNKINKHSRLVGIIIGAGLILFILGSEFFGPSSFFRSKDNEVGEIADNTITYEEYAQKVAETENDYGIRTGKNITENERASVHEQAWNELIEKYAYKPEYDELGLVVTDEELFDMVQGKNIHPTIRQLFSNPQTQEFDKSFVKEFLANIDKREPRDQALWFSVERSLTPERLRTKYLNLFKLSNYVTKEEAKREYIQETAKAKAAFVYVPYFSIPDSSVSVSDADIKDYVQKNKEKYKVEEAKSFDYVLFPLVPSSQDSILFKKELESIAQEFKNADNDSVFVNNNSDIPNPPALVRINDFPEELKNIAGNIKFDSVYGPFVQRGQFVLYKVLGTKNDTVYSARASHILIKANGETTEAKSQAKKEANEILDKIKGGADFSQMARQHGTDGTASRGGDLGWFTEGQMVKKFNDAVFNAKNTGVLPNLVETEFGYHIIKITETKTNKKYELATVVREITPTEETKDIAFKKADQFASEIKDTAAFNAAVKNDSLRKYNARNIKHTDKYVSGIPQPREIIRWAFTDADINDVSPVFTIDNNYLVAILTGEREEGVASVDEVKDEVTVKIRNEKKGDQVLEKIKGIQGSFSEIATKYGSDAVYNTAEDVSLNTNSINGLGYDPVAVGTLFGLEKGKKSPFFKGESGVFAVEKLDYTPAPEIADYTSYKTSLLQKRTGREDYGIDEAIKKKADIEDERYKFF